MNKKRITLFLEEEVYKKLKILAINEGLTMSKLVEKLIEDRLNKELKTNPTAISPKWNNEAFEKQVVEPTLPKPEKSFVKKRGEMDPDDYI